MPAEPDLARLVRTIGDPTRIRMLTLLLNGRALTAKELSYGTGVEPATGTVHLQRLLADSLVVARSQGRHKYFNLASSDVARCIESLMVVAKPARTELTTSLPPIQIARFCYDHLAGRIATQMTDALQSKRVIRIQEGELEVTSKGERWFHEFGVDLVSLSRSRRKLASACLDWSERRDHVGGALGAALAQRMLTLQWITREPDTRVAHVTRRGRLGLHRQFGIHLGPG